MGLCRSTCGRRFSLLAGASDDLEHEEYLERISGEFDLEETNEILRELGRDVCHYPPCLY